MAQALLTVIEREINVFIGTHLNLILITLAFNSCRVELFSKKVPNLGFHQNQPRSQTKEYLLTTERWLTLAWYLIYGKECFIVLHQLALSITNVN